MSMRDRNIVVALTVVSLLTTTQADAADKPMAPRLGTPMTAEDVQKWDITIFPDGRGLPEGKGIAKDGAVIFDKQCAGCHGEDVYKRQAPHCSNYRSSIPSPTRSGARSLAKIPGARIAANFISN